MSNDYPTVLTVICPLFRNFLRSSDQLRRHQNTLFLHFCSKAWATFAHKIISFSLYMFYFVYESNETFCTYWQCLIDCNAQKKNTGSMIGFCNLTPSIEITNMTVAKEPRRFGKHISYHTLGSEKTVFGSRSSDSWCNSKKWTFSFVKYTFAPTFGQRPRGRIELP